MFYRKYEDEQESDDDEPNIEFDGGFQVPGKIWDRLYR